LFSPTQPWVECSAPSALLNRQIIASGEESNPGFAAKKHKKRKDQAKGIPPTAFACFRLSLRLLSFFAAKDSVVWVRLRRVTPFGSCEESNPGFAAKKRKKRKDQAKGIPPTAFACFRLPLRLLSFLAAKDSVV
jgi:hypothetical protein